MRIWLNLFRRPRSPMLPESLRFPPGGKPWLLYGLFGASLVLNLALAIKYGGSDTPAPGEPVPEIVPIGDDTTISNLPVPANLVAPLPEPLGVARAAGTEVFTGAVTSSLSVTFQDAPAAN